MKKWLSILGVLGLTATSTTTLISCEKPNNNENGGGNKPEPKPDPKPEKPQEPPIGSNWKLITNTTGEGNTGKTYIGIFGNKPNVHIISWKGIDGQGDWGLYKYKAIYRWDGSDDPQIPNIDKNTGKISDWKE